MVAALLALAGRRVIVFEREKFPRFHIGESLFPFSQRQITVQPSAMPASGRETRVTLTPLARNAINSLSADSRPKTRRIAVNNPYGMVKMSENGSTYARDVIRYSIGTS